MGSSHGSSDTQPERHWIQYGSERIDFELVYRARKTLAISVYPDLRVEVVAPLGSPWDKIAEKVRTKAGWILRQQRCFLSWLPHPTPRDYVSGETYRYLGRQYQLKVVPSDHCEAKLKGRYLVVHAPAQKVKATLNKWFRSKACARFEVELLKQLERLRSYNLPSPKLRVRVMPKRWGSCTPEGEIILNPDLIKTSAPCIEYVVVHELCHLRHPNHSKAFFKMLDAVLPDWKKRKEKLDRAEI